MHKINGVYSAALTPINENLSINKKLSSDLGSEINFRRVENVGPKVSNELLKSGLLAISLSLKEFSLENAPETSNKWKKM